MEELQVVGPCQTIGPGQYSFLAYGRPPRLRAVDGQIHFPMQDRRYRDALHCHALASGTSSSNLRLDFFGAVTTCCGLRCRRVLVYNSVKSGRRPLMISDPTTPPVPRFTWRQDVRPTHAEHRQPGGIGDLGSQAPFVVGKAWEQ